MIYYYLIQIKKELKIILDAELSNLIVKKIQVNNDHKIYIYKMPSKEVSCYDEIKHFLELGYIEFYRQYELIQMYNEKNLTKMDINCFKFL